MSSPNRSAFPSPPGLEETAEVNASVLDGIEEKIKQLGAGAGRQEIIQAIRESVMSEVDTKVAEKADELWRKGQQAIIKMQEMHKEKTGKLADEVRLINEKHQALEAENEKLKQVINTLHARFSLLGAVFGGKGGVTASPELNTALTAPPPTPPPAAPPPAPEVAESSTRAATTASPSQESSTELFPPFTPGSSEAAIAVSDKPLPEVPAFPFAPAPAAQVAAPAPGASTTAAVANAAPLSLAEALGTQSPQQRTPLSLMQSLQTTPDATAVAAPYAANQQQASKQFSFTIRKADGADLGLNVSHHEHDRLLRVEGVRPEGAVEAWNRQCMTGSAKEKAVMPGDKIIQVNQVGYDPPKMLEECRDKQLLRLTIVRGETPPPPSSPGTTNGTVEASPAKASTTLRAEASVFVPGQQLAATPAAATTPAPDAQAATNTSTTKEAEQTSDKQAGSENATQECEDTDAARPNPN